MLKLFLILLICILFNSCTKELELKLDDAQDKLVVNSLFYPDTNFRVYVTSTQLINENKNTFINDAEVKLYENGNFVENLNFEADGWYVSSINPKYGTKYKITVEHNGRNVEAQSYIPSKISYFQGKYHLLYKEGDINSNNPVYEVMYLFNFLDNKQEENYYQILEGYYLQTETNYSKINNPSVLKDSEIAYLPNSLFFTDDLFNGDTSNIEINILYEGWFGGSVLPPFNGTLKSTSKEYYLFIKTWVKHRFNQNSDVNLQDPLSLIFQGEPIEMYSNVVGGYGVFAGFNKTEVEFEYVP